MINDNFFRTEKQLSYEYNVIDHAKIAMVNKFLKMSQNRSGFSSCKRINSENTNFTVYSDITLPY